ncbi:MAG: Stp1/IreP family PP2C-type Ser/Thr phosphatase [Clostridia bacterium]|nr:Stp1/IreP family PP2C-type Ser/Thr phosphatase [Clostridia bacterium]
MQFFGKTDIGAVRDSNQDSFFADFITLPDTDEQYFLAVVCDGMGGANGGSIASSLAIETFKTELSVGMRNIISENLPADTTESILSYAVKCANTAVYDAANKDADLRGMGTTLVAMVVFHNTVYIANVGDSRLYVIAEDGMCRLTHDHSYVQTLVDKGQITEEQARTHPNKNVIMRAVGTDREVRPDFFKIYPDRKSFLLCSDGLSNFVSETEIDKTVREADSAKTAVESLIDKANAAGGADNITAILVKN